MRALCTLRLQSESAVLNFIRNLAQRSHFTALRLGKELPQGTLQRAPLYTRTKSFQKYLNRTIWLMIWGHHPKSSFQAPDPRHQAAGSRACATGLRYQDPSTGSRPQAQAYAPGPRPQGPKTIAAAIKAAAGAAAAAATAFPIPTQCLPCCMVMPQADRRSQAINGSRSPIANHRWEPIADRRSQVGGRRQRRSR